MATIKVKIITDVKRRITQDGKYLFVFNRINEDAKIVQFTRDAEKEALMSKVRQNIFVSFNGHSTKPSQCGKLIYVRLMDNSKVSRPIKVKLV